MCPGHGGKMLKEVERLYNCAIITTVAGSWASHLSSLEVKILPHDADYAVVDQIYEESHLWHITFTCWHGCGLLNVFCNCVEFRNGTTSSISIKACPTRGVRSWLFCCSFALPELFNHGRGGAWYILVQNIHSKMIVCQEWKYEVNLYPRIYHIWCDFPHLREMIVPDAGDEILGQRAIFQETLRHLLWGICEGSRGTDTCLQILCVCGWVSLLCQYELCLFKMFGWISLPVMVEA